MVDIFLRFGTNEQLTSQLQGCSTFYSSP